MKKPLFGLPIFTFAFLIFSSCSKRQNAKWKMKKSFFSLTILTFAFLIENGK
jgi:hypothetical protein